MDDPRFYSLASFHYLLENIWTTPGFTVYHVFIIYWRIYGRPQVLQFTMFSSSTGEYMAGRPQVFIIYWRVFGRPQVLQLFKRLMATRWNPELLWS